MSDMLFHTTLRNTGLFLTLSFVCLNFVHNYPSNKINSLILSMGVIFITISFFLNRSIMKIKDRGLQSYQKISYLLLVVQAIILSYLLNLLIFKK